MTIATIRPSGVTGDDSEFTGHDLWNVGAGGDGETATFALGTFTLGANVTKRVRIRVMTRSTANDGLSFFPSGYRATLSIGSVSLVFDTSTHVSMTQTQTSAWTNAQGLSQGDIDAASVYMELTYYSPQIYEIYVDVEYVAAATFVTADVSTPSLTATPTYTGTPTVATNSDTGTMTAVQARVFTAAQAGIGGFNPATSPNTWDSGELTQTSPNVTQDGGVLTTSTTYHLYMRVAQTVGGALSWSAWDAATNTFTLDASLNPIGVDAVSAVADSDAGSVTVTVDRDTGLAAWSEVAVQRSTDAGVTWTTVGTDDSPAADEAEVVDVNAPSGVDILYRAQARSAADAISPWVEASVTVSWSPLVAWIKSPYSTDLATQVRFRTVPVLERHWRNGWAQPNGVSAVVGGHDVRSGRSGRLEVIATSVVERDAILAVLEVSPVVLFQFPPSWNLGGDLWAVVASMAPAHASRLATLTVFHVDLEVAETLEPVLP